MKANLISQVSELNSVLKEKGNNDNSNTGETKKRLSDQEEKTAGMVEDIKKIYEFVSVGLIIFAISTLITISALVIQTFMSYRSELRQLQDNRYQLQQDKIEFIDQKCSNLLTIPSITTSPIIPNQKK